MAAILPQGGPAAVRPRPVALVLWRGVQRQRLGLLAALVLTWTGTLFALEMAALSTVLGVVGTTAEILLHQAFLHTIGLSSAATGDLLLVGAGGAVVAGAVGGAGLITGQCADPGTLLAELAGGLLAVLVVVAGVYRCEQQLLRLQGYRRLAWEESERVLPLHTAAAHALGIAPEVLPPVLIKDAALPGAWAHMRAIVLTTGLLGILDDAELAGVLAHELAHVQGSDPAGRTLVTVAALPLALAQRAAVCLGASRSGAVQAIGLLLFWPVNVVVRFVLAPAYAHDARAQEYAADAAAMAAGEEYRDGLRSALGKLAVLEAPRTGWEAALARAHPPAALRIERLVSAAEAAERTAQRHQSPPAGTAGPPP